MARFERGKGNRKRTVEIRQWGTLLTHDEVNGPSVMLTGYQRLSSESSARAALRREAARLTSEKLAPADEEAKALVAELPPPKPEGSTTLPLRQDLYVYNEANGFVVTARRMAGKIIDEGSPEWKKAVIKGDMLPVMLFQDDPFTVRVVVGGDLEPEEDEEWVARIDWHLNVKDGQLCVTGGSVFTTDGYDADDSYYDQFVRTVRIPKGHYRAAVYAYVPGVNGEAVLDHVAGGYRAAEPIGQWFRRTRAGKPFPAWLRNRFAGDPRQDPGHEDEWEGVPLLTDEEWPDYIHFLVHLTPVEAPPKEGLSELTDEGWFGEAHNARKPERCPLGLEGRGVVGHIDEEPRGWMYAQNTFALAEDMEPVTVAGGPVTVPLAEVHRAQRLSIYCTRMAMATIRFRLPDGATFDFSGDWPDGVIAAPLDDVVCLLFSNDLQPLQFGPVIAQLTDRLRALPDGTTLELCTVPPSGFDDHVAEAGKHWYVGTTRDGAWQITKAFPRVGATVMQRALALAAEAENGLALAVADADEGAAIMKWARGNFPYHLEDNPATVENGELRLREQAVGVLELYATAAFAVRFGETWKVVNLADDDGEDDEQDEAVDPWDLEEPPRGPVVFAAPSGRQYFNSAALLWNAALAERIQAEVPRLSAVGFRHAADVVCDLFPRIVVHAYARSGGTIWATFLVAAPKTVVFELSSRFPDGASLLTSGNPQHTDDVAKLSYRQGFADLAVKELVERHEARLAELEATHGPPLMTVATAAGLAEAVEAALLKQLGG